VSLTGARWQRVNELFHGALARAGNERDAFVARECGADAQLRLEVESLLAAHITEASIAGSAISTGTRLGDYEVTSFIAAGAMGQVYRARDTKLGREVALKILPPAFVSDSDRRARFEREARLLASLNHTNIATIYGFVESDGIAALALELVDGETLADRIARGKLSVNEALRIAKQIAEALEAAHEQRIIHRDLKPANIKLTRDGVVKVLDFGLAKLAEPMATAGTLPPTLTSVGVTTGAHVLLGTPAYMSPEQAQGDAADRRSDIWAFGCVLYEMLARKPPFDGATVAKTLASVLKCDVDYRSIPASLHPLLRRCLAKDTTRRWQHAGDVRVELECVSEASQTADNSQDRTWIRRVRAAALVVIALIVVSGVVVALPWVRARSSNAETITRFAFPIGGNRFTGTGRRVVGISPNGAAIVYVADDQLYIRRSNQLAAQPIAGTVLGATLDNPFFSPDGEWVGFWSGRDGTLKKIAVSGGAAVTLCSASNVYGASWRGDTIVFGQQGIGILAVSANGGMPRRVAPTTAGELADSPEVLPGGHDVLFSVAEAAQGATRWDAAQIVAVPIEGGPRRVLVRGGHAARYLQTGHLVYVVGGNLVAVPFDLAHLHVTGGPIAVVERVGQAVGGALGANDTGAAHFDVSEVGTLTYVPQSPGLAGIPTLSMVSVDRNGAEQPVNVSARPFQDVRVSPDGHQIATKSVDEGNDVWIVDTDRGSLARQTFEPGEDETATWSPDQQWIAYASIRGDQRVLIRRRSDGSGPEEILWSASLPAHAHVQDWTRAGDLIVALDKNDSGGRYDVFVLRDRERSLQPLLQAPFNETNVRISPDGRWIAYASNESGRYEVYVRPFPSLAGKWQISVNGGVQPVWSRDGQELFFRGNRALNAVHVSSNGTSFSASTPRKLFDDRYASGANHTDYDISADGQRFIMLKPYDTPSASGTSQVVVVQNWFSELRRLVPTN
jgi:serine/threonine-protein kinase